MTNSKRFNKEKFTVKKMINTLGNIIFIVIISCALIIGVSVLKSKIDGGTPSIAGNNFYIVLSGSMAPVFNAGSIVAVKKIAAQQVAVGNIITFIDRRDRNRIITHRVVEVKKEKGALFFVTKGDANQTKDSSLVPAGNIIGKANFWLPYAGYVVNFTKSRQGLFILLIVPGALYIISELFNIYKLTKESNKIAQEESDIESI